MKTKKGKELKVDKGINIVSFNEIKRIIEKFPKCEGVGFAVIPQLLKIAKELGMFQYIPALDVWNSCGVFNENPNAGLKQAIETNARICMEWEGIGIRKYKNTIIIGLRQLIDDIEYTRCTMNEEVKKPEDSIDNDDDSEDYN
jgi:hypothetical protein